MYKEFFGLREAPFSIAPDPRYLYMGEKHREALAHLVYGVRSGGAFVLLTGEVGTGKTTTCRRFLEELPRDVDCAFILNPKLSAAELLAAICDELGIPYPENNTSVKVFTDRINAYLLSAHARGRKTVLIIEEAQNLEPDVLEQVRLLTNLETDREKLLQIIMLGQPELRHILSKPGMTQVSQRITARYHLGPLSRKELPEYVKHRLAVAGVHGMIFRPSSFRRLYSLSCGVPRLINLICDRALLGAYAEGAKIVDGTILKKAGREVFGNKNSIGLRGYLRPVFAAFLLLAIAAVVAYHLRFPPPLQEAKASPSSQSTLEWSGPPPPDEGRPAAFTALFRSWGINYDNRTDACPQARLSGLECLSGESTIGLLLRLNKPAILKLHDTKGFDYNVTLLAVRGASAVVAIGNETRTVDLKEISSRWLGGYTLLWELPPAFEGTLRPGGSGKGVQWLDSRLALIDNREPRSREKSSYDQKLVERVKGFQKENGLNPDGIVGPRTAILLSEKAGDSSPKLSEPEFK